MWKASDTVIMHDQMQALASSPGRCSASVVDSLRPSVWLPPSPPIAAIFPTTSIHLLAVGCCGKRLLLIMHGDMQALVSCFSRRSPSVGGWRRTSPSKPPASPRSLQELSSRGGLLPPSLRQCKAHPPLFLTLVRSQRQYKPPYPRLLGFFQRTLEYTQMKCAL